VDELIQRLKFMPTSYFVIGGLLIGALYYSSYYDNGETIDTRILGAQAELDKARDTLAATEKVIGNRQQFEAEYNLVSDQFKAAIEYLPSTFNIQSLLRQIYNEARSAGIDLEKTVPQPPTGPVGDRFYEELMIDVQLVGSFSQLTLFLSYVSRLQRIVNIKNIEIRFDRYVDTVPYLTLKGTLVSYRYLEGK
jgi:type IV pilus assembly protein PilO